MPAATRPKLCLDSNVFIAVMLPETTKASQDDIRGADRLLRSLHKGEVTAITSVMALAEVRWVFDREQKPGFDIARATLETGFSGHLSILQVDTDLAVASAIYRRRYYSKSNPFSYNDGIFLATAVRDGATALVTTDPHLLGASEVPVYRPSGFPAELRSLRP